MNSGIADRGKLNKEKRKTTLWTKSWLEKRIDHGAYRALVQEELCISAHHFHCDLGLKCLQRPFWRTN